jgi:hypothetical protein
MKELRITNEDLLLLMDAVNLMESAFVYTHSSNENSCRLKNLRNLIRIAYEDF